MMLYIEHNYFDNTRRNYIKNVNIKIALYEIKLNNTDDLS